jgi:hypothetical protein
MIAFEDEVEAFWDSERGLNIETRTGDGKVLDDTIDHCAVILKAYLCRFDGSVASLPSALVHGAPPHVATPGLCRRANYQRLN